jgi:NTP pyrophosphatase (non-canonical NTP hydrolase)
MTEYEILTAAIEKFGEEKQELKAVEEMCELIVAISHKHFGREHNIAEEIADVEIMLEQLKMINDCFSEVRGKRLAKIIRLKERILNDG